MRSFPASSALSPFFVVSSFLVVISSACFITNCPQGGKKRSELSPRQNYRQCTSCGPPGAGGRCFGPDLCCGPGMGCFRGTAESQVCHRENQSPTPCRNAVPFCTVVERGQCVTEGYCCNEKGDCKNDDSCPAQPPRHAARFSTLPMNDDLRGAFQNMLLQQQQVQHRPAHRGEEKTILIPRSRAGKFLPSFQRQRHRYDEISDLEAALASEVGEDEEVAASDEEYWKNVAFAPRS